MHQLVAARRRPIQPPSPRWVGSLRLTAQPTLGKGGGGRPRPPRPPPGPAWWATWGSSHRKPNDRPTISPGLVAEGSFDAATDGTDQLRYDAAEIIAARKAADEATFVARMRETYGLT